MQYIIPVAHLSPCKHCPDRVVGCHASCEKYINFRKALDERNEEIRRRNNSYVPLIGQYRR